jgi:hypothetical protein
MGFARRVSVPAEKFIPAYASITWRNLSTHLGTGEGWTRNTGIFFDCHVYRDKHHVGLNSLMISRYLIRSSY